MTYRLQHSTGTVEIELAGERLVVKTQGTGLADKLRVVDIALTDLRKYALTPTVVAQNQAGGRAMVTLDTTRDSELIFSYDVAGRLQKKRVFVAAGAPEFQQILAGLRARRPDASLLDLSPRDAYKQIGVLSPQQGIAVVLGVCIGVPVVGTLLYTVIRVLLN